MSTALQIALFLASVAVVVFVAFFIPVCLGLLKQVTEATRKLDELKSDVKLLLQDSRTMVQNADKLTNRAHQQMDEVDKIVRVARAWSERADRIVQEVGDVVEAPIFTVTRVIGIVHKGLSALLDAVAKKGSQPELTDSEGLRTD